ncbi:MAG: DsbA family protein [Rubritepida sp.]|nr:DsbA family protein [Rubritepida sp.]
MTVATYLFDPLCGWCYGAAPVVERLAAAGTGVELLPVGLAEEARPIDAEFAGLIWGIDRRIWSHTGQPFTAAYRALLFSGLAVYDAWPATLAVIAVARTRPERQLDAFSALQIARFVMGRDTGDALVVETVLREIGLRNAADLLAAANPVLIAAADAAVIRGRRLLRENQTDGVPALLLDGDRQAAQFLGAKALMDSLDIRAPDPALTLT